MNIPSWLPPEILFRIFFYLDEKDLRSVARVSRVWKEVSEKDHFWKPLGEKRGLRRSSNDKLFKQVYLEQLGIPLASNIEDTKPKVKKQEMNQEIVSIATLTDLECYLVYRRSPLEKWNLETQEREPLKIKEIETHSTTYNGIFNDWLIFQFFPQSIVKSAVVWSLEEKKSVEILSLDDMDDFTSLECVKKRLFSRTFTGWIKIWDIESGRNEFIDAEHNGISCFKAWDHHLFTSAEIGLCDIKRWDIETKKCLGSFVGNKDMVECLDLFDTHTLISGSRDGNLITWDLRSKMPVSLLKKKVPITALSHIGDKLIVGDKGGKLEIWNLSNQKYINCFNTDAGRVKLIHFLGTKLVGISQKKITTWDFTKI